MNVYIYICIICCIYIGVWGLGIFKNSLCDDWLGLSLFLDGWVDFEDDPPPKNHWIGFGTSKGISFRSSHPPIQLAILCKIWFMGSVPNILPNRQEFRNKYSQNGW